MIKVREKAIAINRAIQIYNKKKYDSECKINTKYQEGDLVYIPHHVIPGSSSKLQAQFKGPYIVRKTLPNNRYVVSDVDGIQLTRVPFTGVFDPVNMKLWDMKNELNAHRDDVNVRMAEL